MIEVIDIPIVGGFLQALIPMIAKSGIAKKFATNALMKGVQSGNMNVTDIVKGLSQGGGGQTPGGGGQGGGGLISSGLSGEGYAKSTPQTVHKDISSGSGSVIANIAKRRTSTDPLALALKKDKK